jgi:hypothetical protein
MMDMYSVAIDQLDHRRKDVHRVDQLLNTNNPNPKSRPHVACLQSCILQTNTSSTPPQILITISVVTTDKRHRQRVCTQAVDFRLDSNSYLALRSQRKPSPHPVTDSLPQFQRSTCHPDARESSESLLLLLLPPTTSQLYRLGMATEIARSECLHCRAHERLCHVTDAN